MVPDLVSPEQALEMATIDAARALGMDDQIGSLEPGKLADVIVVSVSGTNWIPMHDFSIVPNLVYSGDGGDVETVIINGALVMESREIKTVDVSDVAARAQRAAEEIVERLPYRSQLKPMWKVE